MTGLLGICCGLALLLFTTGCGGSMYGWTVRTTSSQIVAASDHASLGVHPIAVLTALSSPGLRGSEAGLAEYLAAIIRKVSPHWSVLDVQDTVSLINGHGLAGDYVRLRAEAEQSHILDRDILRKLGAAVGARFVFQPRLAYFSQEFEDRWSVPAFNVRVVQTRYSTLRVSLSLWDTSNGELVWSSLAEANLQSEAVNQDPVFFEDAARIALASMISDLLNRKTSSKYTPYNVIIDQLMREAMPQKWNDSKPGDEQDAGSEKGRGK
jgi:hypothetical protein